MLENSSNPLKTRIVAWNKKNFESQNLMDCSTPRIWRHYPNVNKYA